MRVLIYRYNSICEPDIIKTFQEMGIEVVEYTKEITVKDYSPSVAVKEIGDFLQDHPVDFVFSINFFPYVSEVCNLLGLKYLCWIVDSPVLELYTTSIVRECNRVFVFDRALAEEIFPLNPGRIFHLPLAANVDAKDELFKDTQESVFDKFSHDIAFVGSLYTEKCPYDSLKNLPEETSGYFDSIINAQEKIYGYYFIEDLLSDYQVDAVKTLNSDFYALPEGSFLTDKRTLAQYYIGSKITANERVHTFSMLSEIFPVNIYTGSDTAGIPLLKNMGRAKTLTEMPVIFNQSKININITSKMIRSGLPLRIFDILSSGGFLITNYQSEIPEFFTPGEDLVMYSDMDELEYLISYYLDHDEEREAIAKRGREIVREHFTYKGQLAKLLAQGLSDG